MTGQYFGTHQKERNTFAKIILVCTVASIIVALAWPLF